MMDEIKIKPEWRSQDQMRIDRLEKAIDALVERVEALEDGYLQKVRDFIPSGQERKVFIEHLNSGEDKGSAEHNSTK